MNNAAAAHTELIADGVSRSFGGVAALKSVSIVCQPGEIVGLIGPNGAGKTTLLNVLTGVHLPDKGSVILKGVRISGRHPHEIARLGLARTFQNIRLFARLTVEENVEVALTIGRRYRGSERQITTATLLQEVSLDGLGDRVAGTLSYGHQRRLEIARALALRPDFLLLDEPAAGASEKESRELAHVVDEVRGSRGCGVVVIDHDIRFVMTISDRLYVLDEGEVISTGSSEHVQGDPKVAEVYLGTASTSGSIT